MSTTTQVFQWRKSYCDTRMFMLGLAIGIAIQIGIGKLRTLLAAEDEHRWTMLVMGIAQVFLNALIINGVSARCQGLGLFMLGILSPQFLLVRHAFGELVK